MVRVRDAGPQYRAEEPEPRFLSVSDVVALHQDLIARYGGDPGILDARALEAAVAQPAMTAFGQLIHPTLIDQAAAYLFHLVANHPFCDGNKRVGLLAAQVFLLDNGTEVRGATKDWYDLTMAVAKGTTSKRQVAETIRRLVRL